ncbi:MAG: ATP-grasp domain-containing protein [Euryarchaeota archaeon]|nr:ATP-grasp domain-containing protein [Euryarchaeota archaeon]
MKILIIGYSTRYLVCAAKHAGYTVYSLDHFGDSDLLGCADRYARFDEIMSDEDLLDCLDHLNWDFDAIVLGTGFEYANLKGYRVLNNPPDIMRSVGNKRSFAEKMRALGVPHPKIYNINDDIEYPVMVKPIYGVGGVENRLACSSAEIGDHETESGKYLLIQECLAGVPASVSVISTRDHAVAIAVNEQLIGTPWLTTHRFAYCGNITPLQSNDNCEMCETATRLILNLGLIGSNGVDFLITKDGPVVIEVNARFQGTIDTVEAVSGISVFGAHVKAFGGELPEIDSEWLAETAYRSGFAGKAIVFADSDITIDEAIVRGLAKEEERGNEELKIMDIPQPGCRISAGDPMTTLFYTGRSRDAVLFGLNAACGRIRGLMLPLPQI